MGDASTEQGEVIRARKVAEITKTNKDHIGDQIVDVFSSNAPYYAIYRTSTRLVVQYADDDVWEDGKKLSNLQRTRISPLMPLRGQINGLIDGWHSAALRRPDDNSPDDAEPGTLAGVVDWLAQFLPSRQREARRAFYYDRRVADALIVLLDDPGALETSQTLLTQIKNDIITERTTIARSAYLRWAVMLAGLLIVLCAVLASGALYPFLPEAARAWSAVAGGSAGAFFSLALGLKGRNLTIDLQSRENMVDVVTRMLIGAIAGGIFYALVATEVVTTSVFDIDVPPTRSWGFFDLTVFLMGFVAGFAERMVPNLLNTTNFATAEPVPANGTPISPTAKPAPPPAPPAEGGAGADADSEACLCDGEPAEGEAVTPDHELPASEGGVEVEAAPDPAAPDPAAPDPAPAPADGAAATDPAQPAASTGQE